MQAKVDMAADLHEKVQSLVDDGLIKQGEDGRLVEIDDPAER